MRVENYLHVESSSNIKFLFGLPNEVLTEVFKRLNIRTIKTCLKVSSELQCKIKENYALWREKCPIKPKKTGLDDIISTTRREHLLNRAWVKGLGAQKIVFETNQCDVTHLQIENWKVMTSSDDHTVKMIDLRSAKQQAFTGHFGGVWAFMFNENTLATGSIDKTVRIWNVNTGSCQMILKGHKSTVRTVKITGSFVISGGRDGDIRVWNTNGDCIFTLRGHKESVRCIDVDEDYLISGSYDGSVLLWNFKTGKLIRRLLKHSLRVYCVIITQDYMASGGQDGTVHLASKSNRNVFVCRLHRSIVAYLGFSFDRVKEREKFLVTSGADGIIGIWNVSTRILVHKIVESGIVTAMKVFKNFLVVGTANCVKLYNIESGKFIRFLLESVCQVYKVDVSDDVLAIAYKYNYKCYLNVHNFNKILY